MLNEYKQAIITGLKGKFIHRDPLMVVKDLTAENALKKVNDKDHSCWDLLHHIVVWQDIFLANLFGYSANWNPENNWPSASDQQSDEQFSNLLNKFKFGLKKAEQLLEDISEQELKKTVRIIQGSDTELSRIRLFVILNQHLSYHTGQLANIRKQIEPWPKEEK